jgi:hypothetical protein
MFLEQIGNRFVDQFLKGCHPSPAEVRQLEECVLVDLYALPWHY